MRCVQIFVVVLLACLLPARVTAQPGMEPLPIGRETDIYRLVDLLDDHNVSIRVQAATRLEQLGDKRGVDTLEKMLKEPEATARLAAARALGTFRGFGTGAAHIADELALLLRDPDAAVRDEVAFSLGMRRDARSVAPLIALLANKARETRLRAVSVLGLQRDPRVAPAMSNLLQDTDAIVRLAAIRVLTQLGDTRFEEPLLALCADPDTAVCGEAIELLGQMAARFPAPVKQTRVLEALLIGMKSPVVYVRVSAISGLRNFHDPRVVPALLAALDDPEPSVRVEAIRGLGTQQDTRVAPALLAHANDTAPGVHMMVISSLGQLGDARAAGILLDALGDKDHNTRNLATQYIVKLLPDAPGRITERLTALLASTDEGIRANAVTMLGKMGDIHAIEPMLTLLKSPRQDIRNQAVQALAQIDDPRAAAALIAVLPDIDSGTRNALIWHNPPNPRLLDVAQAMLKQPKAPLRVWAIEVAQQSGSARAIAMLVAVLKDPDAATRQAAARALGSLNSGTAHVADRLAPLLQDPAADVRAEAAVSLGLLRDPRAVTPLRNLLASPTTRMRQNAVFALGQLRDPRVVPALIPLLRDTDVNVRLAALRVLPPLEDMRAVEPILSLVTDSNPGVCREVVEEIGLLAAHCTDNALRTRIADALQVAAKSPQAALRQAAITEIVNLHDSRVVSVLLAALDDPEPSIRRDLIGKLWNQHDPRIVPALMPLLHDADATVRVVAMRALGESNDIRAVEPLLALTVDQAPTECGEALTQLGYLAGRCPDNAQLTRIADALLTGAKSPHEPVRTAALSGLGSLSDARAVPVLLAALDDPAPGIRSHAIRALAWQHDARVVPALLAHANDPDSGIHLALITGLGQLRDARAADFLLEALGDTDANARDMAAQYLGSILPDAPQRIADRLEELQASTDEGIRTNADILLVKMGDPHAIAPTTALLKSPRPEIRAQAAQALAEIDDPRATTALIAALPDLDAGTRNSLVWQHRGNPRIFDVALALFKQPQGPLNYWAIQVIQQSSSPRARDVLLAALHDADSTVRVTALNALQRFTYNEQARDDFALPEITALAADADPSVRVAAISLLGALGRPVLRALFLTALRDPEINVRLAVPTALSSLSDALPRADARIVTALIEAGKDADPRMRKAVINALGHFPLDPRVPDILYAAINDPASDVRDAARRAYLDIDGPHAGAVCLTLLKTQTSDETMQQEWGWQFSHCHDPRVRDALLALVPGAGEQAKQQLLYLLAGMREPRVIPPLLTLCRQRAIAANPTNWDHTTFVHQAQNLSMFGGWQDDWAFQSLGASVVEPLLTLLTDDHRAPRAFALVALAQLKDARAYEPLLAIARGDDPVLRCYAIRALGALSDVRALTPLLAYLKDAEPGVRATAAQAVGNLGDTRVVAPLLGALQDTNVDLRNAATDALNLLRDARAVEPLLAMAQDGADTDVRRQAIDALGYLHDMRATDTLLALLRDHNRNVRHQAFAALGELRDPRAVEPLLAIATSKSHDIHIAMQPDFGGFGIFLNEQQQATRALAKIGDPRTIDFLLRQLAKDDSGYLTGDIIKALGAIADIRVMPPLLTASSFSGSDTEVPAALAKIGAPAIPALLAALADHQAQTRRRASAALAIIYADQPIADAHARALLLAALQDSDATVCGNAAQALLALGEPRAIPVIAAALTQQDGHAYTKVLQAAQSTTEPRLLAPLLFIATQADGASERRREALRGLRHIARAHPDADAWRPAVAPLLALLREQNPDLRTAVAETLGNFHDPRITPALLPLLQDAQANIRHAAMQALAARGDQRAVEPLLAWLGDLTAPNRVDAVKALENFRSLQVCDALIAALQDPAPSVFSITDTPGSVREQAALTLGALGDKRAVPALIASLDYGYLPGRRRAAEALGMLKDRRAVEPLITALRHFAGDAKQAPAAALKAITGQDFGVDAERWQAWWDGTGKKG